MREYLLDCPYCGGLTSVVMEIKGQRPRVFPCCGKPVTESPDAKIRRSKVPAHLSARAWFEMRHDSELRALLTDGPEEGADLESLASRMRGLGGLVTDSGVTFPIRFHVTPDGATPNEVAQIWQMLSEKAGALPDRLATLPPRWGDDGERLIAATRQLLSLPEHASLVKQFPELAALLELPPVLLRILADEAPDIDDSKETQDLLRRLSPRGPLHLWPETTRRLGNKLRHQIREAWQSTSRQYADGPPAGQDELGAALIAEGHNCWRNAQQEQAARVVLEGRDGIVVLPTGTGKTLCYTLPARVLADEGEGYVLVVSPLLALMADQVRREDDALRFEGNMDHEARAQAFQELDYTHIVYVSPELLLSEGFREALCSWRLPSRIVIDEAHCVLDWGHTFRQDYLRLGKLRKWLSYHAGEDIPLVAFSATLTPHNIQELQQNLELEDPIVVQSHADRPELRYAAFNIPSYKRRLKWLTKFIQSRPVSRGLVYCSHAKKKMLSAELVAEHLRAAGIQATHFHGGLPKDAKNEAADKLRSGQLQVVVATSAFGMGVDLPWLDWVVHVMPPTRLSAYLQGAGRAGRNMDPKVEQAICILLGGRKDKNDLNEHLFRSLPKADSIQKISDKMVSEKRKKGQFRWDSQTGLLHINPFIEVARSGALAYAARHGGVVRHKDQTSTSGLLEQTYVLPVEPEHLRIFHLAREKDCKRVHQLWEDVLSYINNQDCLRDVLLCSFGSDTSTTASICCLCCEPEEFAGLPWQGG
ncbi:MAG: RecQ family ATP-dependent DNA helicase [Bradymonadia bacterium]